MENIENSSNNTALKAGLVIASVLALIFGFLYFNSSRTIEERNIDIDQKTKELLATNSKLDSISHELDLKIAEVQMLGGQVTELQELKAQLEQDKKQLMNSKNVSIKEYQDKLKGYEAILAKKDDEIAQLRAQNGALEQSNQNLNQAVTTLKTEKEDLIGQKTVLADSVHSVTVQNRELSEKVTLAAALKPVDFSVEAINRRGRAREGTDFKAKKIDKIKVDFKLVENPLTQKGTKVIYMRLKDPQGNVIADRATGSGDFSFGGKETVYTAKKSINFTNTGQRVDFEYSKGSEYKPGTYTAEFYSEGFRIGQTSFTVD